MENFITIRNTKPNISFLMNKKTIIIFLLLLAITFVVLLISAGMGTLWVHPVDVLKALAGTGTKQNLFIVRDFRLPRILSALMVGAFLASSGAILQCMVRNPLGSPDIIGITGGASAASVTFIILFQTVSIRYLPFAALLGATAATLFIYLLSWKNGITPLRLVLTGVGTGAGLSAFTTFLTIKAPSQLTSKAIIWMTGSVYGANWINVSTLLLWGLVLFPVTFLLNRSVNIQQLGDDVAVSAGNPVQRHRFILLLLCSAFAGCAVAIGGAIGFVGLIAPHIARKLVGNSFGSLLPISALTGGLVVMLADLLARTAFAPLDIPVGIFTAAVGAPFFLYLLYKSQK